VKSTTFEVRLARRASQDLVDIYEAIEAESSLSAAKWFIGLESAILDLEILPSRGQITPERTELRHLLYGNKPHVYRVIYSIDEAARVVNVAQIRHGARRPLQRR
jgi:toxin ParE1/3/4